MFVLGLFLVGVGWNLSFIVGNKILAQVCVCMCVCVCVCVCALLGVPLIHVVVPDDLFFCPLTSVRRVAYC